MRHWTAAGLALALAACSQQADNAAAFTLAHGPGPVEQVECRQGECYWTQRQSVAVLGKAGDGIKLKLVGRAGNSVHGVDAEPPQQWAPGIEVDWQPETTYFFCSLTNPAMLWRSNGEFVLDTLDLYSPPGAQVASANEYMAACHSLAPGEWDSKVLTQFGYAEKGSDQQHLPTLEAGLAAMGS